MNILNIKPMYYKGYMQTIKLTPPTEHSVGGYFQGLKTAENQRFYSTVMEWFSKGVKKHYKSHITYEIDFLEILLNWKDKNEK